MDKDDSRSPLDRRLGENTPFQPSSDDYKTPPPTPPPSSPPPSGPLSGPPVGSSAPPSSTGPAGSPPTQQQGEHNSSIDDVPKSISYSTAKIKPRAAAGLVLSALLVILLVVFLTQGSNGVPANEVETAPEQIPTEDQQEKLNPENGSDESKNSAGEIIEQDDASLEDQQIIDLYDPPDDLGSLVETSKELVVEVWCEQDNASGTGWPLEVGQEVLFVTNHHVIEGCKLINQVYLFVGDSIETGIPLVSEIVSYDQQRDLALIRSPEAKFPPFTTSFEAKTGHWVMAVGNPKGLIKSVNYGSISNIFENVEIPVEGGDTLLADVLYIDAAINQGNSGGPLINSSGEVIGINTLVDPDAENIAVAVQVQELCSKMLDCNTFPWTLR